MKSSTPAASCKVSPTLKKLTTPSSSSTSLRASSMPGRSRATIKRSLALILIMISKNPGVGRDAILRPDCQSALAALETGPGPRSGPGGAGQSGSLVALALAERKDFRNFIQIGEVTTP